MKITKKIKPNKFFELLKSVQKKFGPPFYYEELIIYLSNEKLNIKLTVKSSKGIILSHRDHIGNQLTSVHLESSDLKNLLVFLADIIGNSGFISISPAFEFIERKTMKVVKLINNSFIGPIVTLSNIVSKKEQAMIIGENCLDGDQKEKLLKTIKPEKIIDFSFSQRGILNQKIISYAERNGIYLYRDKRATYRDVLEAKSNDYQNYADVFSLITNHDLISKQPVPVNNLSILELVTVSIIIPCYNSGHSIKKVLESIAYQQKHSGIRNLEVILIDDGSVQPVIEFTHGKHYLFELQIIRLEHNRGLSNARKVGVSYSRGEILIFIDSDILLEKNYLREHVIRNLTIPNAVFVSFKENIKLRDNRISSKNIRQGLNMPDYSKDLRIRKAIKKEAIGSYKVKINKEVEILESTNYFKSFSGSRVFGVYDLSCMIIGHNFSARKDTILQSEPFSHKFIGWGMEDVYFGLKLINKGNFIIPVLSTGVYHIDHPLRSNSEKKKINEYKHNTKLVDKFLNTEVEDGLNNMSIDY